MQVEVARGYTQQDFREDLKKLYALAGVEGKSVMFLITDKQIVSDSQVEDISSMLNTGEVRGLFQVRAATARHLLCRPVPLASRTCQLISCGICAKFVHE